MTLLPAAGQERIGGNTVLASPSDTGGAYTLYRIDLPPRAGGARPHFHRTFVESFTVLSGTVTLLDGSAWVAGGAGDHLVVPVLGVHGFRNDTDEPASMLMLSVPGADRGAYFRELLDGPLTAERLAAHDQFMVEDPAPSR